MNQPSFSNGDFQQLFLFFILWPLSISAIGSISHILFFLELLPSFCLLVANMMASSQVEFAATPNPFGHVHAHRGARCYEKNVSNHMDYTDLWVHQPHWPPPTIQHDSNEGHRVTVPRESKDRNGKKTKTEEPGKNRWARAREIFGSVDNQQQADDTKSESAAHNSEGGVSSLVRKWRGFEAVAKYSTNKNDSPTTTTATTNNSPVVIPDNNTSSKEEEPGDWEPDRMAVSGPPSIRSSSCRGSDATETDRLRVSDIIRKLTEEQHVDRCDQNAALVSENGMPRVRTSLDHPEQRSFSPVVNSPRIRGRQAFTDLLMHMERERHKELEGLVGRGAVSKFSHRGRIQALLRFKFLRQGIEGKEGRHINGPSSGQPPKLSQFASVPCREKVKPSVPESSLHTKSCHKELTDDTPAPEKVKENQHQEEEAAHSVTWKEDVQSKSHQPENNKHDVIPLSTFIWQQSNRKNNKFVEFQERARTFNNVESEPATRTESMESNGIDMHGKDEEATGQIGIKCDLTSYSDESQGHDIGEASSDLQAVQPCQYWVSDVCHGGDEDWEELNPDDQESDEGNNTDWIYEVSRPRSDWEDLRQARYQEMLDPYRENEEIRSLLGRKSVSSFLSSGLRDQIDRVMLSRSQGPQITKSNQTREDQVYVHDEKIRVEEEEAIATEEVENKEDHKQEEDRERYGDYFDEYEEAASSVGQQYNECDDYITSASPTESWPQNQSHEAADFVASPSPQQSLGSNFYSQDSLRSSSIPAIEMEFVYDLRRHMEQLQLEMSELRSTIKSCVNMQSKLQWSIKREVSSAVNPSDEKKVGAMCRVCCKLQVDSLLYRCGHMCTCFKCAQELQWGSGKCPICRAPIMDVVRTYYSS